jgi:hypothetical protein
MNDPLRPDNERNTMDVDLQHLIHEWLKLDPVPLDDKLLLPLLIICPRIKTPALR